MTTSRFDYPSPGPHYQQHFGGSSNNSPQPFPNPNAYNYNGAGYPQANNSQLPPQTLSNNYQQRPGQSPQAFHYAQQQQQLGNYPIQSQTPSSSIISASSAAGSPRNFPGAPSSAGSTSTTMPNYAYYSNQQLPQQQPQQLYGGSVGSTGQGQQQPARDIRTVSFKKGNGSLGIRVVGGNQVGIFVMAVQTDSLAAQNGIK